MHHARFAVLLGAALMVAATAAPETASAQDDVTRARDEFLKGAAFIRELQYSDALAAFERSAKLKPHAVTTYNIGACHRALGRYTLARKTLRSALAQSTNNELSDSLKTEANGFLTQIEQLLAHVDVVLTPADATIAVDGHPLEVVTNQELLAGTRPPGPGEVPPGPKFAMVVDPGSHVITLTRKGFADSVVNKVFAPHSQTHLDLALDRLPATLAFASNMPSSVVTVDAVDVGVTPVDIQRPAGHYKVVVKKPGFVPYETEVNAQPGERVDLRAQLKEDKPALTQRWWFWTAAGVVVAGAVAATYFATRPEPERPPLNGGGLGWTLQTQ